MARVTAKFSFTHDRVRARRGDVIEVTDRVAADLSRRGLVEFDGATETTSPLGRGTAPSSSASQADRPSPTTTSILSAAGEALATDKPRRGRKPKPAVS